MALRNDEGNFSAKQVLEKARLSIADVSVRTVTRLLNKEGYFYLQGRKKGLLQKDELKKRLAFVREFRDREGVFLFGWDFVCSQK